MGIVPVDPDHKGMAEAVRELEFEDEVGDEADLVHGSLVRELHAQRHRIAGGASLLREAGDDVVEMDALHVVSSTSGELQRDREIDDLQLMLDERTARLPGLPAPFDVGELDAIALDQYRAPRSASAYTIGAEGDRSFTPLTRKIVTGVLFLRT